MWFQKCQPAGHLGSVVSGPQRGRKSHEVPMLVDQSCSLHGGWEKQAGKREMMREKERGKKEGEEREDSNSEGRGEAVLREREGIENRGREKRKETVKERRSGVERERKH